MGQKLSSKLLFIYSPNTLCPVDVVLFHWSSHSRS